jgi:sugar fermentation stimulation protein A
MKFPELIPGTFIKRDNRFSAAVRLGTGLAAAAYVPTTGRLTGVLRPGARVWLERSQDPNRRTSYTLVLTELEHGGLCCVNAIMANRLFYQAVAAERLAAFPYNHIEKEVPHGRSRLDFRLSQGEVTCWVEVKSVTYVEDGVGMFPDAPTSRGRRHLETLASLVAGGDRASAVFIAQRSDAQQFTPFEAVDPGFTETLHKVAEAGVDIHAYRCAVDPTGIEILGEMPVCL